MASAAELFIRVSADTAAAVGGLAILKRAMGDLGMGVTGGAIAGLGVGAVGAAIAASVEQAAKFQTALVNVQNNTTMTAADMGKLRTSVLELGQATGVPFEMLSTGFMRVMNITGNTAASMDILKIATESAVSTGGNAATTANILANAMHEYGADVSHAATEQGRHNEILQNATRYMGIFHLAAAEGNMTLEQFADNSGKAVGIAANLGIGVDQVSAAISSLTKHGYDAAMAQTQVVNIMTHMINPAKKASAEIERVSKASGVNLVRDFSAAGLHARGLTGVMADLRTAFLKMGYSQDEATQSTMVMLNAQRGGLGMSSLIGTAYQDYTSILKDLNNQQLLNTVTSDAFARSQQTLGFQWNVFKEKIQAVAIAVGTLFLPMLTRALSGVNTFISWLTTSGLPMLQAFGGRLVAFFLPIAGRLATVWAALSSVFRADGIGRALQVALEILKIWGGHLFAWIGAQAAPLLARLRVWGNAFIEWIGPATQKFLQRWPIMLQSFLDWIAKAAGPILTKLVDWATAFVTWITPMIPKILTALGFVAAALLIFVGKTAEVLLNTLNNKWAPALGDWAKVALPKLGQALATLLNTIADWAQNAGTKLHPYVVKIGHQIIDGIKAGILAKWTEFSGWLHAQMMKIPEPIRQALGIQSPSRVMADEVGRPIVQGIAQGIDQNGHVAHEAAKKLARGLPKSLQDALAGGMTGDQFKRGLTFGEARHEDHAGETAAHHLTRSQIHQRHIQNEALKEQHHKEAMARKAARHAHHMQVLAGQHARHQAHIRRHHAVVEGLGKAHHARMTGAGGTGIAPTGLGTSGGSLAPNFDLTINIYEDANGKVSAKTTSKGGMGHLRLHLNQLAGH